MKVWGVCGSACEWEGRCTERSMASGTEADGMQAAASGQRAQSRLFLLPGFTALLSMAAVLWPCIDLPPIQSLPYVLASFRTYDPEEADYFFVPTMAGCLYDVYGWNTKPMWPAGFHGRCGFQSDQKRVPRTCLPQS